MPTLSERARELVRELREKQGLDNFGAVNGRGLGDAFRRAANMIESLSSPIGGGVREGVIERLYVQFSDDGHHIRKWSRKPFDDGSPMEALASTPTDRVEIQ